MGTAVFIGIVWICKLYEVAETQEIYLQARQLLAAEGSPYSTVLVTIVDVEFTNVMPGKKSEYLVLPGAETGMERCSLSDGLLCYDTV